jgi:hypothetical protein
MYLRTCESFKSAQKAWVRKSQNHKLHIRISPNTVLGLQIAELQSETLAECPQIL